MVILVVMVNLGIFVASVCLIAKLLAAILSGKYVTPNGNYLLIPIVVMMPTALSIWMVSCDTLGATRVAQFLENHPSTIGLFILAYFAGVLFMTRKFARQYDDKS